MLTELFFEFFLIGAFSFGGGYGTLAMIEQTAVTRRGWLTSSQLHDLITIAEVTPGPISLNAASFTGHTVCGIPGAIAATIGCILPSCVITALLFLIYRKYGNHPAFRNIISSVRAVVCAMIFSAFLSLFRSFIFPLSIPHLSVFLVAFALIWWKKSSPTAIILLSGVCGILIGRL